jgi:hypothetical protein
MAIDQEAAAAMLYGNTTPASAPAPVVLAAQPATPADKALSQIEQAEAHAERLFNDPDDRLDAEGRDAIHAPTERAIETAGVERFGMDPAEAQASAREWSTVFREFALNSTESGDLTEIALPFLEGTAQVDRTELTNQSRTALTAEYGSRADQVLDASRRLVARHPGLAKVLDQTGLGSHPAVVRAVARRADTLQRAGKL